MFADITADELQDCIKRPQRGKGPGIDGVCAGMIKDSSELLHSCLLELFNCMLSTRFPECLSVGVITAVFKAGDKQDMGNCRGITVGPVFAKLFAMIFECRLAAWAEEHGVKARGQAGFRKDHRTTDNVFVLRSLIDKQKQSRQKGGSGKLYCCFVDFRRLIQYQGLFCGRCLKTWECLEGYSPSLNPCMRSIVLPSRHQQACLKFSDACWG